MDREKSVLGVNWGRERGRSMEELVEGLVRGSEVPLRAFLKDSEDVVCVYLTG